MPERYIAIAEMYMAAGKREEMRKVLVRGAAETGDARIYFMLGCADGASGLDPVIYWTKALESEDIFCEASDMIDFYENASPGTNIYYTGNYSGVREEFRYNGIRRRINMRLFESGKAYADVTDFVPVAMIREGDAEEFSYALPPMENIRVLYVLRVNDELTEAAEYTDIIDEKNPRIIIKGCGESRYAVVKYSCCIEGGGMDSAAIAGIPVVMEDEFVEDMLINAVYSGTGRPGIFLNSQPLRVRDRVNESLFSWNDSFSKAADEDLWIRINTHRTPEDFAAWYSGLVPLMGRFADSTVFEFPENVDAASALRYIMNEVFSGIAVIESPGLVPRAPDAVMADRVASPLEKAFLALAMLKRAGINGSIAFGLSGEGTFINEKEVLVYVRVNENEWYWLPVSSVGEHPGGQKAIVILESGGRVMPVEEERIIKE